MTQSFAFSQGPALLVTLTFDQGKLNHATLSLAEKFHCEIVGDAEPRLKNELLSFLENYGKKALLPTLTLPLDSFTPFRKAVLSRLQQVPFGEVLTYGELASTAGHPGAARAVGSTCRDNPFPLFIPCHRVVASGQRLGGFAYNIEIKKRLLDFEACPIEKKD